ncbi:MAG: glutathione peroxidase [Candidatus Methylopumilus sp.]|nr:glutathione peroxidase [Candidatus Methylopumilus sp.]
MKNFLQSFLFFWIIPSMSYAACLPLYDHQFNTLQGEKINLCDYQSKPILVVNTASKCGFTPQFNALEALYKKYNDKGLLVIGFPSNDFNQELSTDKEVRDFCKLTYAVEFPMTSKSSVTGKNANPFYQELIKETGQMPKWNFYKYLILPQGKKVYAYPSTTTPDSSEILDKIKAELK